MHQIYNIKGGLEFECMAYDMRECMNIAAEDKRKTILIGSDLSNQMLSGVDIEGRALEMLAGADMYRHRYNGTSILYYLNPDSTINVHHRGSEHYGYGF